MGSTRNADAGRRAITEKLGQIRVIPGTRAGDGTLDMNELWM